MVSHKKSLEQNLQFWLVSTELLHGSTELLAGHFVVVVLVADVHDLLKRKRQGENPYWTCLELQTSGINRHSGLSMQFSCVKKRTVVKHDLFTLTSHTCPSVSSSRSGAQPRITSLNSAELRHPLPSTSKRANSAFNCSSVTPFTLSAMVSFLI